MVSHTESTRFSIGVDTTLRFGVQKAKSKSTADSCCLKFVARLCKTAGNPTPVAARSSVSAAVVISNGCCCRTTVQIKGTDC